MSHEVADREVENGRKRANEPKQRRIEEADAEIRISERGIACVPALKSLWLR